MTTEWLAHIDDLRTKITAKSIGTTGDEMRFACQLGAVLDHYYVLLQSTPEEERRAWDQYAASFAMTGSRSATQAAVHANELLQFRRERFPTT